MMDSLRLLHFIPSFLSSLKECMSMWDVYRLEEFYRIIMELSEFLLNELLTIYFPLESFGEIFRSPTITSMVEYVDS